MQYKFTKMHGLGNDFMVLDQVHQSTPLPTATITALADRKTGIGFDQLLLVEAATDPSCDFRYRIYNADGGEVEHCGNGIRCVANFILAQHLSTNLQLRFQMDNGFISTQVQDDGSVTVDMQPPILNPADIPFLAEEEAVTYELNLAATEANVSSIEINALSMGNPHAVILVDDVDTAPVTTLGPIIEHHRDFPNRVNVGFMEVVNPGRIRLRVFERGAGETLACGTGACAAVVAGRLRGLLEETVTVELIGGTLKISWAGNGASVFMTGPATSVFEGQIDL